jgi:hypothetical protein
LLLSYALTFGSAPGKSMAVIGPPSQALAAIAKANGRILASTDYVTIARSDDADFVGRSMRQVRCWCWTPNRPAAAAACHGAVHRAALTDQAPAILA